jgi:hypothetical protein
VELIPILSTIILVATISTFILAIGAYILYKIREAKGQQSIVLPASTVRAEVLSPVKAPVKQQTVERERIIPEPLEAETRYTGAGYRQSSRQQPVKQRQPQGSIYRTPATGNMNKRDPRFMKYTSEGYIPAEEDKNGGNLKWR